MNLEEIRGFCSKRGIPYRIMAESAGRQGEGHEGHRSKTDRAGPCPALSHNRPSRSAHSHPRTDCPRGESAGAARTSRSPLLSLVREGVRGCHAVASGSDRRTVQGRRGCPGGRHGVLDARRSADLRGVRPVMDEGQGRAAPAAHAGVRLSDRPQTPSRRQRVEGCSQSQGKVRSEDAGESRSSLSGEQHRDRSRWRTQSGRRVAEHAGRPPLAQVPPRERDARP